MKHVWSSNALCQLKCFVTDNFHCSFLCFRLLGFRNCTDLMSMMPHVQMPYHSLLITTCIFTASASMVPRSRVRVNTRWTPFFTVRRRKLSWKQFIFKEQELFFLSCLKDLSKLTRITCTPWRFTSKVLNLIWEPVVRHRRIVGLCCSLFPMLQR